MVLVAGLSATHMLVNFACERGLAAAFFVVWNSAMIMRHEVVRNDTVECWATELEFSHAAVGPPEKQSQ